MVEGTYHFSVFVFMSHFVIYLFTCRLQPNNMSTTRYHSTNVFLMLILTNLINTFITQPLTWLVMQGRDQSSPVLESLEVCLRSMLYVSYSNLVVFP
jgi:hypothetical protein